jgi:hypothetical protein
MIRSSRFHAASDNDWNESIASNERRDIALPLHQLLNPNDWQGCLPVPRVDRHSFTFFLHMTGDEALQPFTFVSQNHLWPTDFPSLGAHVAQRPDQVPRERQTVAGRLLELGQPEIGDPELAATALDSNYIRVPKW